MILKNHASASVKKERLNLTSKARGEASRNKFMEKSGMPDRVENLREVDHSKNRLRAGLEFVKPIQNEPKKEII